MKEYELFKNNSNNKLEKISLKGYLSTDKQELSNEEKNQAKHNLGIEDYNIIKSTNELSPFIDIEIDKPIINKKNNDISMLLDLFFDYYPNQELLDKMKEKRNTKNMDVFFNSLNDSGYNGTWMNIKCEFLINYNSETNKLDSKMIMFPDLIMNSRSLYGEFFEFGIYLDYDSRNIHIITMPNTQSFIPYNTSCYFMKNINAQLKNFEFNSKKCYPNINISNNIKPSSHPCAGNYPSDINVISTSERLRFGKNEISDLSPFTSNDSYMIFELNSFKSCRVDISSSSNTVINFNGFKKISTNPIGYTSHNYIDYKPGIHYFSINKNLDFDLRITEEYGSVLNNNDYTLKLLNSMIFSEESIKSLDTNRSKLNENLKIIDYIDSINLSNITDLTGIFNNSNKLKYVKIIHDSTPITKIDGMFSGCSSLKEVELEIPLTSYNNLSNMFSGCSSLKEIPLFDTLNIVNMSSMFNGCSSLKEIPEFNCINVTDFSNILTGCTNIRDIYLENINSDIDISSCKKMNKESILYMINNLVTQPEGSNKNIILGDLKNKLSAEEINKIQIEKRWTIL